ncbi:beta-ketoacyl synthase N-terminal-like domain-containing protein [Lewinella sp. IMCC34191]|uniref:beta-ketoacyl synthase N-terminal-like domain-containing protein n=1 Tax=Lewinella sp. IMCC34191 TaxID=2259172 RepID=UPI0018E584C8|nr:beta-ketoacyl synthase N-terminal-like domain-containing protein [Lewinella sp. IMCC34191]
MTCSIAGYGAVSAAGTDSASAANTYRNGTRTWRMDDATGLPVFPVNTDNLPEALTEYFKERETDRAGQLALAAAVQAVDAAGWKAEDFSILVGCSRGPTTTWEATFDQFRDSGFPPVRTSPRTTLGSLAFLLGDYFQTGELTTGLSVTCSSGSHAILHGMALLAAGLTDRVLVGGTEAPLTPFTIRQMQALRVYAEPADHTTYPCRPLTSEPTGMVLGEGAGFLALERISPNFSLRIDGVGFAREQSRSSTGITPDGKALQAAMRQAMLGQSRIPDLLMPHAPGTRKGDAAEHAAIQAIFGDQKPVLTSTKWATGHTFGASGPLALIAGLQMLEAGECWLPPYLASNSRVAPLNQIMVNATGFGGNALSAVISHVG